MQNFKTGQIVTLKMSNGTTDTRTIMRARGRGYTLSNGVFVDLNFVGSGYVGLA